MLSSEIKRPGPEDGTDKALGVKGDGPSDVEKLETTNSVLASAGTVADDQQGLELLERAPRSAIEFDTEATRPRSKIRVVAVMCALFVSCTIALYNSVVQKFKLPMERDLRMSISMLSICKASLPSSKVLIEYPFPFRPQSAS